jgi:hypothetical protein
MANRRPYRPRRSGFSVGDGARLAVGTIVVFAAIGFAVFAGVILVLVMLLQGVGNG